MRWVVLTPTFAAGLGVVVAAAMAAPTHTVQLTTMPKSQPCATPGCVSGKGTLAARPRPKRLVAPARVPTPSTAHGATPSAAGQHVLVQYQTVRQDRSGSFVGQLILASGNGQPLRGWVLQFSYPGQIRVWGGRSESAGQHSVTLTAGQYSYGGGWAGWSGGRIVQVVFTVSGQAGPPASCTIDGQPCRYSSQPGPGPGDGGYGSGGYGGGRGSGGGSYGGYGG